MANLHRRTLKYPLSGPIKVKGMVELQHGGSFIEEFLREQKQDKEKFASFLAGLGVLIGLFLLVTYVVAYIKGSQDVDTMRAFVEKLLSGQAVAIAISAISYLR